MNLPLSKNMPPSIQRLWKLTQESAVRFDTLVEQLQALTQSVQKTNFARLDMDDPQALLPQASRP